MTPVAKGNRGLTPKRLYQKTTNARNKESIMITNSESVNNGARKKSFRILTAVITVLFVFSVTVTAFAATNVPEVTVVDGEKSVTISAKTGSPREIVKQAGFNLSANDDLDLSAYSEDEGGTIVIERAKIVRIEDNGIISYFVSYGDTVSEIFKKEGIKIGSDDEIGTNPLSNIFDGMRIFVKRAFTVNIEADGENSKVFLTKGTVADALEKAGVAVSEDDIVFPSLDTKLNGFTDIRIFRVKYETKIETQPIEYKTEKIFSDELYVDEKETVTKGENGEKSVFYIEKYVEGELEETLFSKEVVKKKPVNEVVKVGTKSRETLSAYKNTDAPISELKVPSDLKLDENGVPVDYAYCVSGKATAYTGDPATASGRKPMPGHIAVDPKEFPYGTELYVVSADGSYVYGYCVAADTGGFVSMGNTDIDLYMDNEDMCYDWGNRNVKIYVLN